MDGKILNITNGDAFNGYFLSRYGGEAVPFREAMMDGDTVSKICSSEFIRLRARELNVSEAEYRANMAVYGALDGGEYAELVLWFGKDTFCQMNLLTLLAYLEEIGYGGKVTLNYIDDETFTVTEANIGVTLGTYQKLYETVFMHKQPPQEAYVLDSDAIRLYFDYHSENGALAKTVRDSSDMEHMELMCRLMEISKEYGLSDVQAERLILRYRSV